MKIKEILVGQHQTTCSCEVMITVTTAEQFSDEWIEIVSEGHKTMFRALVCGVAKALWFGWKKTASKKQRREKGWN